MGSIKDDVSMDFSPIFRVLKDGCIDRLMVAPRVPPSVDPVTGVQSHDVVISSDPEIRARIFLPKLEAGSDQKLPVLIYYHGGAFAIGSPFNIVIQNFLTPVVAQSNAIAVALQYRLAPENPLPIAFHDSWAGFQWVVSHSTGSGPEPLLNKHADFGRVFLGGESAGATIAQHVAVKASVKDLSLRGLIAIHPFFAQSEPDKLIQYLYPTSSGTDADPLLNPESDPDLGKMGCSRILVLVAEKDFLKPRGVKYVETLKKSKWEGSVEFEETEGEDHCFHLFDPNSEKALGIVQKVASFII